MISLESFKKLSINLYEYIVIRKKEEMYFGIYYANFVNNFHRTTILQI